jgi:signal transduction histidine kinase
MSIGRIYSSGMPGRRLSVTGRVARFPRLARLNPWPGWISNPLAVHVALSGNSPTMLSIESQPSESVLVVLRQRAALLGLGGIAALVALAFAVRATTRPIVRLARDIRTYRGEPASPDLVAVGSPELRDLAQAYNEMKGRIAELIAERTRVLAAIAHDMRTYITRIRLRAEFIDDVGQRERAVRDLDEMAALLDDTLLLARAEARVDKSRRRLDLAAELRRMVEIRREMGDTVSLSLAVEQAPVVAAPLAIRRILSNLVDNALRHGTQVVLTLCEDDGRWRIDVKDDGPGVPDDRLGSLGEPFGRIDPSRDRSAGGGAGLGLAIVRALVAAEEGRISFANRGDGGFVVSIWIMPPTSGASM